MIVGGLSLAFVLTLLLTPVIYVLIERIGRRDVPATDPQPAE